jgi:hypothetical protein
MIIILFPPILISDREKIVLVHFKNATAAVGDDLTMGCSYEPLSDSLYDMQYDRKDENLTVQVQVGLNSIDDLHTR